VRNALAPIALFATALAFAPRSHATTCAASPGFPVFWPQPSSIAPINTHVSLELPERWRASMPGGAALVLVAAPTPNNRAPAPLAIAMREQTIALATPIARIDLAPTALLTPYARYEVRMVDASHRAPDRIIATFTTGSVNDTDPPRWSAAAKARYVPAPPPGLGIGAMITIDLDDGATDNLEMAVAMRYGIWVARGAGKIDYSTLPALILFFPPSAPPLSFTIGEHACDPRAISVDAPTPITRVGVRAIDSAGNMSTPAEAAVIRK
jgi:hypothetical protein